MRAFRCRRHGTSALKAQADSRLLAGAERSFGFLSLLCCLPRVFWRSEAARLPDRRVRHISFSFNAAFFAKNVFRAGTFGALFREIARICHEKGAEKLWRKNKDCATARKTPRREAGRGRVEDDEAFSSTPNEHRAEALNCAGRRPDEIRGDYAFF